MQSILPCREQSCNQLRATQTCLVFKMICSVEDAFQEVVTSSGFFLCNTTLWERKELEDLCFTHRSTVRPAPSTSCPTWDFPSWKHEQRRIPWAHPFQMNQLEQQRCLPWYRSSSGYDDFVHVELPSWRIHGDCGRCEIFRRSEHSSMLDTKPVHRWRYASNPGWGRDQHNFEAEPSTTSRQFPRSAMYSYQIHVEWVQNPCYASSRNPEFISSITSPAFSTVWVVSPRTSNPLLRQCSLFRASVVR